MSQNIGNNNTNCQNIKDSYNTTTTNVTDDRPKLLEWLSPLDPGLRHSDIQERRVKDVGEWLIRTEEFKRWCRLGGEGEGGNSVLFCYGNPGAGKSFISSLVVDRLCYWTRGQHTPVTCFYFDFAARKAQTATSMLGSMLKQMISGTGGIPEEIWRALGEQREALCGRKPQLDDIVKMLQLITSSQPTFMVIDALDESTALQRYRLLDSLNEILDRSPGTRVFVTGRPYVRQEIETRLLGRVTSISACPTRDDIARFLRVRISEDEIPDAMDSALEADILEKIPGSVSEMFLLASLNIEAIMQESTLYRRRERLNKITDGLGLEDVYGVMIERIKAQDGDKPRLGMGALMWISYAEEDWEIQDLCWAQAVELGSTDFNESNIPSISTLVNCCQGLITADKGESTVRLIHFTLKEYLSAHPNIFGKPHSAMAEICLTYLNSRQAKAISAYPIDRVRGGSFIYYCSERWGVHAKGELSGRVISLALELFKENNEHLWSALIRHQEGEEGEESDYFDISDVFNALHCASYFGSAQLVAALIEMKCYDLNGGDYCGRTPLTWAAWNGQEGVVKMLLGRAEVNPDQPDEGGRTPLIYATKEGHGEVVKMLLGRGEVNPDHPDEGGRTPLMYAVMEGHGEAVKMLLGRQGVNPNHTDKGGRTPLSYAAAGDWFGLEYYLEVVEMLLERGVNPDRPDNWGRTPLSYAAGSHSGWAFQNHLGVVKMLLGRKEVNTDKQDNLGRTPLSYASESRQKEVVKLLLGRKEVNPNEPDKGSVPKRPVRLVGTYRTPVPSVPGVCLKL